MAVKLSSHAAKLSSKGSKVIAARTAKTAKGKRILKNREPKVHEDAKSSLILRGAKSDPNVTNLLKELHDIRKPVGTLYAQKHDMHPFEEAEGVEKLCKKVDASLFALGSKSKKRPFRLLFGRTFDGQVLDMHEFDVKNYVSASKFKERPPMLGSKPLIIFQGAAFDQHPRLKNVRSILLDFFRGATADKINLQNVDHAIVFSVVDQVSVDLPSINMRHYRVDFKRSGEKNLPLCKMAEVGPRFDLSLDREKMPDPEIMKQALRIPKEDKTKKVKNIETDALGRKKGRVHLGRQDFSKIHTPHFHKRKAEEAPKETKEAKTE